MADTLSSTINGLQPFIHDGRDHFPQGHAHSISITTHSLIPRALLSLVEALNLPPHPSPSPEGKLKPSPRVPLGTSRWRGKWILLRWLCHGCGTTATPPSSPGTRSTSAGLLFYDTGASAFGYVTVKSYPSTSKSMWRNRSFTTPCDCPTPLRRQISTIPEPQSALSDLFGLHARGHLVISTLSNHLA